MPGKKILHQLHGERALLAGEAGGDEADEQRRRQDAEQAEHRHREPEQTGHRRGEAARVGLAVRGFAARARSCA